MNKKIAVVGDCSTDHFLVMDAKDIGIIHPKTSDEKICFNYGEKIPIKEVHKSFGGSALNVATTLSSLGLQTELASFVGKDFEGKEIIGHLQSNQIGADEVIVDQETNQSFVVIYDGERTVLSNHLKRKYSKLKIPKSDYLYLASAGEGSEELVNNIRSLVSRGSKLIFNPGGHILRDFDFFKVLMSDVSLFIINSSEADDLFEDLKIKDQLAKILALGTKIAVITDGANGAYFATENKFFHMHASTSQIVDPTGAGDAFAAALLGGIIHGKSLEEAAKWGALNASAVIEKYGSTANILTIDEVDKKEKQNKILKFCAI